MAHMALAAQRENEERPHDEEEVAKSRWRKLKRGGLIGAAAVTGGALLAVTGGMQNSSWASSCNHWWRVRGILLCSLSTREPIGFHNSLIHIF